jgi:predicted transcriptional regulator
LSKQKEKPALLTDKAALLREALDQVTGGHMVPSEEVEAWIESWDTADEQPKPRPRKR